MQIKKQGFKLASLLVVSSVFGLSACQSTTGCAENSTKCFGATKTVFKNKEAAPGLNPQFNYIRLIMNGHTLWLAQGATEPWPVANTKVFYSADRSVFKWSNGRLTSVTTPFLNWREYLPQTINWSAAKPFEFSRDVDSSNGAVAMTEQREMSHVSTPKHHSYVGDGTTLVWVHEYTVLQSQVSQSYPSYNNWYAFESHNMNEPVYGQQCISKQYCLSWQVWKTL